jgi:hypothetical protein
MDLEAGRDALQRLLRSGLQAREARSLPSDRELTG